MKILRAKFYNSLIKKKDLYMGFFNGIKIILLWIQQIYKAYLTT